MHFFPFFCEILTINFVLPTNVTFDLIFAFNKFFPTHFKGYRLLTTYHSSYIQAFTRYIYETFVQWLHILFKVKNIQYPKTAGTLKYICYFRKGLNPLCLLENTREKNLSNTGTQSHITPHPPNRLILLTLRGVRQKKQNLSFI